MRAVLRLAIICLFLPAVALAQEVGQADTPAPALGPILTLNQDRLFDESLYGQRLEADIEAALQELARENRRIEAELEHEERQLTALRPTLPPEEFRPLAEAFDAKVTDIRRTQDGRNRQIAERRDQGFQQFFSAAVPILATILDESQAQIIIDSRSVFLASEHIDITAEALRRIDAVLGTGEDAGAPLD